MKEFTMGKFIAGIIGCSALIATGIAILSTFLR